MTDYTELVKALRWCAKPIPCSKTECPRKNTDEDCACHVLQDAAAAIEALQAQMPKRGEWVRKEDELTHSYWYECSECGYRPHRENYPYLSDFCPNCGAKMEVQG